MDEGALVRDLNVNVAFEPLKVQRSDHLPALSWFLRVASGTAELTCGTSVETAESHFFEGSWSGPFEGANFAGAANVFGSGATRVDGTWMLVPPSHTLEAIYVLRLPDGTWVASNSLAFLLEASGASIHYTWPGTLVAFVGIVQGVTHSPSQVATSAGTLHILHFHNALLADELRLVHKPSPAPFDDFESYRAYLQDVLRAVAENAGSTLRRARYSLMAALSSGYDSPACAALARSVGCQEGMTIGNSRDGRDDDGTEIGNHLGLRVSRVEHPFSNGTPIIDPATAAEFFATGMQGEDITFAAMDGLLTRRLLLTGHYGGWAWDLGRKGTTVLERADISGSGFTEFRLRHDFIHLPLPFVGGTQLPSIRKISRSPAMRPFAVGGDYDRPIPRRIAEEAGVPRQAFGQSKKAVATLIFLDMTPAPKVMQEGIERQMEQQTARDRRIHRLRCARYRLAMAAAKKPWKIRRLVLGYPWKIFEHLSPTQIHALDWALAVVRERYRTTP